MNNAQKYLLDNGFDDLLLNNRTYTKVEDRMYASDVMMEFAIKYHEELSKLHQPTVMSAVCEHKWESYALDGDVEICVKCDDCRDKQTDL